MHLSDGRSLHCPCPAPGVADDTENTQDEQRDAAGLRDGTRRADAQPDRGGVLARRAPLGDHVTEPEAVLQLGPQSRLALTVEAEGVEEIERRGFARRQPAQVE